MPIYEYRCEACGHQEEFLQKVSEPPMAKCPACGKASFSKMLSAAGFQLKGSGWYATDFKGSGKKPADKPEAKAETKAEAKTETKAETTTAESKTKTKIESKAATAPAGSD
jgi:putative FmdB family regulatory protein